MNKLLVDFINKKMPTKDWMKRKPLYITDDERKKFFTTDFCNDVFGRLVRTKILDREIYTLKPVSESDKLDLEESFKAALKSFSESIKFVEEPLSQKSQVMRIIIDSKSMKMFEDNKNLLSEIEQRYVLEKLNVIHNDKA